jgi:hypothetical protein
MQPVLRRPSLRDHLRTETMLAPVPVAGPPGPRARLPAAGIVRDICQIPLQQAKLSMNLNTRQDIEGWQIAVSNRRGLFLVQALGTGVTTRLMMKKRHLTVTDK